MRNDNNNTNIIFNVTLAVSLSEQGQKMIQSLRKCLSIFALSFLVEISLIHGYPAVTKQPFSLEELLAKKFSAKGFNAVWISGKNYLNSCKKKIFPRF